MQRLLTEVTEESEREREAEKASRSLAMSEEMPPVQSAQGTVGRHSPPPAASSSSSDNSDNSDSESSSRGSASEDASTPLASEQATAELALRVKGAVLVMSECVLLLRGVECRVRRKRGSACAVHLATSS